MTIYLDAEFRCHTAKEDGMVEVTAPENFAGMCDKAIECMRYVPEGMTYKKADGTLIHGEFIQCFDSVAAMAYQEQYDEMKSDMEDMREALNLLGVIVNE